MRASVADFPQQMAAKSLAKARANAPRRLRSAVTGARPSIPSYEVLYQSLLDGLPGIVFRKDVDGRFVYVNRRFCEWLGRTRDEIIGRTDYDLFSPEIAARIVADDRPANADGSLAQNLYDFPDREPARAYLLRVPVTDEQGAPAGYHGLLVAPADEEIKALQVQTSYLEAERKRAEEQLARQALYDGLTNLPNRALFINRVDHIFRRAIRHAGDGRFVFALLYLDIDRFKGINESMGHQAGDDLVVQIARRLEGCLRPSDTLARFGGDEFAILLEDLRNPLDATHVAERVHEQLAAPFTVDNDEIFLTVSIGISISNSGYRCADDMLRDADTAMYRAKANGRSRHEVFEAEMHRHAVSKLRLESDLRRAIERREFVVFYQPILEIEGIRLVGFEALVRWRHPQRGLLAPAAFLPLAEEAGLIAPISLWVLEESCRQLREWQVRYPEQGRLKMSVNLSSRQIAQPDLVDRIQRALQETGLDPALLTLEITESALMQDLDAAADVIRKLRVLGIELNIDDFGTGYSSLNYLRALPVDALKIDRSFVSGMRSDGDQSHIVQAIISMAHSLGMKVVAEGVETREQLEVLRALRCNGAQGYLFARPMPAVEAEPLIHDGLPALRVVPLGG